MSECITKMNTIVFYSIHFIYENSIPNTPLNNIIKRKSNCKKRGMIKNYAFKFLNFKKKKKRNNDMMKFAFASIFSNFKSMK